MTMTMTYATTIIFLRTQIYHGGDKAGKIVIFVLFRVAVRNAVHFRYPVDCTAWISSICTSGHSSLPVLFQTPSFWKYSPTIPVTAYRLSILIFSRVCRTSLTLKFISQTPRTSTAPTRNPPQLLKSPKSQSL